MKTFAQITNGGVLVAKRTDTAPTVGDWREIVDGPKPSHDRETQEVVQDGWTIGQTVSPRWAVLEMAERAAASGEVFDRPIPVADYVPREVPLWAFRAVLTVMGIAPQVDGMLNALSEPQRTVAQTQWVYGNYIVRNHPLIQALGSQIGLTHAQIDDVFRKATTLS